MKPKIGKGRTSKKAKSIKLQAKRVDNTRNVWKVKFRCEECGAPNEDHVREILGTKPNLYTNQQCTNCDTWNRCYFN